MGGSKLTPNIFTSVPNAADIIYPIDESLVNFTEAEVMDVIRDKRYDLIIQCNKTFSAYMEMIRNRDELLHNYTKETEVSNLKILMTRKLCKNKAYSEYNEVIQKANEKRITSWSKVLSEVNMKLIPQVKDLELDIRRLTRACRKVILDYLDLSVPPQEKDYEIFRTIQQGIFPMLTYTTKGLAVFKSLLKDIQQPEFSCKTSMKKGHHHRV